MQKNNKDYSFGVFRNLKCKLNGKSGFTLVELIVVLVIMGILTAAIIPTVTGYVADARDKVEASNLRMVEQAARLYLTDWETNESADATALTGLTASKLVDEGYLSDIGDTDFDVEFQSTTDGNRYLITVVEKDTP